MYRKKGEYIFLKPKDEPEELYLGEVYEVKSRLYHTFLTLVDNILIFTAIVTPFIILYTLFSLLYQFFF